VNAYDDAPSVMAKPRPAERGEPSSRPIRETPARDELASYDRLNGLNHLGIVVDDLDDAEERVTAAGLTPRSHADYEPGRRFYFDDADGLEFEVIAYDPS